MAQCRHGPGSRPRILGEGRRRRLVDSVNDGVVSALECGESRTRAVEEVARKAWAHRRPDCSYRDEARRGEARPSSGAGRRPGARRGHRDSRVRRTGRARRPGRDHDGPHRVRRRRSCRLWPGRGLHEARSQHDGHQHSGDGARHQEDRAIERASSACQAFWRPQRPCDRRAPTRAGHDGSGPAHGDHPSDDRHSRARRPGACVSSFPGGRCRGSEYRLFRQC